MIMQDKNNLQIADSDPEADRPARHQAEWSGEVKNIVMNRLTAMVTTVVLLASASTEAQMIVIARGGSRAVRTAPTENFTGSVRVEMLFEAIAASGASGGSVTFEPGSRTAWHSHPGGSPDRHDWYRPRSAMG